MAYIVTNQKKTLFHVKETVSQVHNLLLKPGQFVKVKLMCLGEKTSPLILKKSTIQRVAEGR